jgi:hypothetical protein
MLTDFETDIRQVETFMSRILFGETILQVHLLMDAQSVD